MKKLLSLALSSLSSLPGKVAAMMFCLGMNAMIAQLVMTRELMVVFYGNELAIGIIFALWLIMVSAGSLIIRPFLSRLSENGVYFLVTILLVALAAALPLLIFAARALRIFFGVPMGEYMALGPMMTGALLALAPMCLIIGIVFPSACRLTTFRNGSVAGIYTAESAGSMVAGMAFSFIFVSLLSPMGTAVLAALCAVCGAGLISQYASLRRACWLITAVLAVLLLFPRPINALERQGIRLRWESFGILPRSVKPAAGGPQLIASKDSRYQNLALIKSEDQTTMYSNGQVMFVFPDIICAEQKIHFIMAQKPSARRVLLIGGNPVNDIPELLKYPLTSLTHVELDAVINKMLMPLATDDYRKAMSDSRLRQCLMDGPRFVKKCRETFDVVIVEAPEPTTISLNRFYTVEFYGDISRILARNGFFYTAILSSEQLQDETVSMVASISQALQAVFPRALVTAGPRNHFFAGREDTPLTFDGKTLYQRSRGAGVKMEYFRPEYFLNADEISAEKTNFVRGRISSVSVPVNSTLRPISAFYNLSLWSRYSGSRIEHFLNALKILRIEWVGGIVAACTILLLIFVIGLLRRKTDRAIGRAERTVIAAVIAATGFTGIALELILIFMFQTLLGYIYASIGCLIAMFMFGLAAGAFLIKKYLESDDRAAIRKSWLILLALEAVFVLIALGLPLVMKTVEIISAGWPAAAMIYFLTLLTGLAGGAQFILAVDLLDKDFKMGRAGQPVPPFCSVGQGCPTLPVENLYSSSGTDLSDNGKSGREKIQEENKHTARNAALLNAVDLAGAALGSLIIGIILLPLFGFGGTCYLLAILKTGTFLLIGAFLYFNIRQKRDGHCR